MPPSDKTAKAVLQALGLTGALAPSVVCCACLDMAVQTKDSGYSDDTGDTGDTAAGEGEGGTTEQRVLDRQVLPDDVARLLADKLARRSARE
jgi:hypothetical protein